MKIFISVEDERLTIKCRTIMSCSRGEGIEVLREAVWTTVYSFYIILILLLVFKAYKKPSKIYTVFVNPMIKLFYIRPV